MKKKAVVLINDNGFIFSSSSNIYCLVNAVCLPGIKILSYNSFSSPFKVHQYL